MNTHFHLPLSLTTFLPIFGYPKIDEARHCTFEMYFTPFPRREIIISNSIYSATRVYLLFIVGRSNMVRAVDPPTHGRAAAPWKQSILASHPRILSISILARSITRVLSIEYSRALGALRPAAKACAWPRVIPQGTGLCEVERAVWTLFYSAVFPGLS